MSRSAFTAAKQIETYNNFVGRECPPFLFRPEGEPPSRQKPQNSADKPPVIGENELYREGYQINGRRENKSGNVEYILENSKELIRKKDLWICWILH